ncbi:MAG: FHA domain-containing protein [Desulfobacterales bacterium]|nr:FHA domain-containing protein [Desulfobacterales bacterium]
MPTITLKYKDKVVRKYRIEKGNSLKIGRLETNDIVIASRVVSGLHAKIDSVNEGFLLTDLQSKNGTYVNGEPINSHYLKQMDVVSIGNHSLTFYYELGESLPEQSSAAGLEQTMVMDVNQQQKSIRGEPSGVHKKEPIGVLSFLTGTNEEVELTKKITKIGKAPNNDIVIKGMFLGKTAVTISRTPEGYFISYVGGMSKPKINGKSITDSLKLEEFDDIEIGSAQMQFYYKS